MKAAINLFSSSSQRQRANTLATSSGRKKEISVLRSFNGFSLLETLITLSIISLLALIGASFSIDNKKHQLEVAVGKINSGLNLARFKAVHHQRPVRVSLKKDGYEISEYEESLSAWIKQSSYLLEGVQIEANNSPIFYPNGTVSNLVTIRVGNERGLYSITIAITGRAKITRLE
ncbi:MAG: prepilin-type N-terminal cleavage/methylation domain-containing protein [Candidatus Aminicenantes bacterium]|nr:prepilin-type N-terminal cleavage/methylation domain-containing protein [Candidatus Aminicenantes bacterium]